MLKSPNNHQSTEMPFRDFFRTKKPIVRCCFSVAIMWMVHLKSKISLQMMKNKVNSIEWCFVLHKNHQILDRFQNLSCFELCASKGPF